MLHGSGELLDLREVVVSLVETWRESVRPGDNTLLPEALPPRYWLWMRPGSESCSTPCAH